MAKLEDLLQNSKLIEAANQNEQAHKAFGVGYFVDPSGRLYNIGMGKTHEEWANNERNGTVNDLIGGGWTRMRNFNFPSMNYVQGDSNSINNIWYLIDLADQVGKSKIVYWVGRNRIELVKTNKKWKTINDQEIGDITESKLRTVPIIVT